MPLHPEASKFPPILWSTRQVSILFTHLSLPETCEDHLNPPLGGEAVCFCHVLPQFRVSPAPRGTVHDWVLDFSAKQLWSISWGCSDIRADRMQPKSYNSFISTYRGAWGQPVPLVLGEDAPKALTGSCWTVGHQVPICTPSGPCGMALGEHFSDRSCAVLRSVLRKTPGDTRTMLSTHTTMLSLLVLSYFSYVYPYFLTLFTHLFFSTLMHLCKLF